MDNEFTKNPLLERVTPANWLDVSPRVQAIAARGIDDDFAFATRHGLMAMLEENTPPADYGSFGVDAPFARVPFDFVMQPAADESDSPSTRGLRFRLSPSGAVLPTWTEMFRVGAFNAESSMEEATCHGSATTLFRQSLN